MHREADDLVLSAFELRTGQALCPSCSMPIGFLEREGAHHVLGCGCGFRCLDADIRNRPDGFGEHMAHDDAAERLRELAAHLAPLGSGRAVRAAERLATLAEAVAAPEPEALGLDIDGLLAVAAQARQSEVTEVRDAGVRLERLAHLIAAEGIR